MSATVLVTGATGFVGRYLVPDLAARGFKVRAAARDPAAIASAPGVETVLMPDLAEAPEWRPLVAGITHIVHLAGLAHATADIPETAYISVNAEATRSLAIAARMAGVRRMVLLSSVKAQSDAAADHVLRETDEPRPVDAYGRSKLAAERWMSQALAGSCTEHVSLRPVLIHGPGVKGNMAALQRLARTPWPLPLGSLRARRSILSLANLASAIRHSLVAPDTAGGIFLVSDPEPVTVPEMIAALRAGLGRGPGLIKLPLAPVALALSALGKGVAWTRVAGDLVIDTSALRATGWQPVETSLDALRSVLGPAEVA